MKRIVPTVLLLVALVALPGLAEADLSKKVIASFKGQIIVSDAPLPEGGKNDKATIAAITQAQITAGKGTPNGSDVIVWQWHYTAFLKQLGASNLKFEFYSGDKYVADKRLEGVDPKDPVLEGDLTIDEDEGPAKGKTYTVKLVAVKGSKEVVVATTSLALN